MNIIESKIILIPLGLLFLIWPVNTLAMDVPSYLNEKAKQRFKEYLTKPKKRAFAYSSSGAWGYGYGYENTEGARKRALKKCREYSDQCRIISMNDRITVHNGFVRSKKTAKNWFNGNTIFILSMIGASVISLFILFRFKKKMASPDDRNDIRTRTLEVKGSQTNVLRTIENYATQNNWLKVRTVEKNTIVLETKPGFINDGYFFRIKLETSGSDRTILKIGCRPRMALQFWHPYATRQTNRLTKELGKIFTE